MSDHPTPILPVRAADAPATPIAAARPAGKVSERRSLARRSAALVRRWARDTFNREQLLSSLRALAWVAPLTLLIWIYAEREQQVDRIARFQIAVKSAEPSQVSSFVSASDQNVTANLKGPKARLDKALEQLDPRSGGGPVTILIDGNRTPNQYEIDILAQIQKDFRLESNGVTVEACTPRYVRFDVDVLQEVELTVKADPQARFPTPPTFDPPMVKIMAPAAAVRAAAAKGEIYAKATLPTLSPGTHSLKTVPVTVEGLDPKIPVRPSTVSAQVEVGQADVEGVIASVPVFPLVEVDQQAMDNLKLRFDQFVSNVKVVGPPEKIRRLDDASVRPRPKATFVVSDNDVGKPRV